MKSSTAKSNSKSKKSNRISADEILPEYDFSRSRPNPYASRYRFGSSVVVLDPDVAAAFPSGREVNRALRALVRLKGKGASRRTA